jgi:DNA-binding transcriptional ArsR family regulator
MEKRRDVFQAISDPTRREIIHLIAARPLTVNGIAEKFNLTRPTISEHVKMLHDCGLLWVEKKGRERYCVAQLEKLGEVADWVSQYKAHWSSTLDSLEKYLDKKQASKKAKSKK